MQADGGLSFAIFMLAYILIAFFVQAILLSFTDANSVIYIAVNSAISPLAIFLVVLYQVKYKRRSIKILSVEKFNKVHILTSLLLSLGMFFGLGFVNSVFADFLTEIGLKIPSPTIPLNNLFELIIFSITVALLPAIFEELLFRGILLNSLKGENLLARIFTVSLCFSLYHCSVSQLLYQFIYGVAFCLLAILAKSVVPCIIAHFLNNFAILLLTYLKIDIDLTNIVSIILGLIALIAYFLICFLGLKGKRENIPKKGLKYFYLPFGVFALGICLLMILSSLLV